MGISNVNMALGASYGAYSQKLTQATRNKLVELGIPFSENITEEQAKKLIRSFEVSNEKNSNQQQDLNNNQQSSDLFERAKRLAKELGIKVDENIPFKKLLVIIESVLSQKIDSAQNNLPLLEKLQELSRELSSIQAQSNGSSGYDATNEALMKSLEMLSEYNKNFFQKN